jgi:hypothetical protein
MYADKTAIMSDYISVIPGAYSINHPVGIICYDSNKNYIGMRNKNSYQKAFTEAITSFTITNECRYIRMLTYTNEFYPASITENTMLNSGSEPLPYEPYIENTDLDVTLPALPTLTGTNVLSVGTEVQPSNVYIKYEGAR